MRAVAWAAARTWRGGKLLQVLWAVVRGMRHLSRHWASEPLFV